MIKCDRCDHDAEVLSFYVEEVEPEKRDAEENLCRQCHSARVNESRGMFYSFGMLKPEPKQIG